jgi:hypothetical protein
MLMVIEMAMNDFSVEEILVKEWGEEDEEEGQPFLGVEAVKRGTGIVKKKIGARQRGGP